MPFRIPRRDFLKRSLAGGAGASLTALAGAMADEKPAAEAKPPAASGADADRVALISDTHIAADAAAKNRDVNMADNLRRVIGEITVGKGASRAIITGDLALGDGKSGDYARLIELLAPLSTAGITTDLLLGNHDHRERFRTALADRLRAARPLESHHVTVIETPKVDWILLDSLETVAATPGRLGPEQLAWLAKELDRRPDHPALIAVHHHPEFLQVSRIVGIADSKEFIELISARKRVKGVFFGHTHLWSKANRNGIWFVNLPPTAYVFHDGAPNGWVDAKLTDKDMTLTLQALDRSHPKHGETWKLAWR
jgi:Icc protein